MFGLALDENARNAAPVLAFALATLLVLGASRVITLVTRRRRRFFSRLPRRRWNPYFAATPNQPQHFNLADVGDQLEVVMAASFQKQRVLSPSEYRVFKIVEDDLAAMRRGYRVFGQTSLGEILRSSCPNAFQSINGKRADILVIDSGGWPVLAIEYQGEGHYQGKA